MFEMYQMSFKSCENIYIYHVIKTFGVKNEYLLNISFLKQTKKNKTNKLNEKYYLKSCHFKRKFL